MPRVFVPQYSRRDKRIDISDLRRYGEVIILFERMLYPDTVDDVMPVVMDRACAMLADFDEAQDFMALVGSPIYIAVCAFVLGRMDCVHNVRWLRFDRIERGYYPIDTGVTHDRLAKGGCSSSACSTASS